MAKAVLIDSGAIVAALRRRDQLHAWARSSEALTEPCLTCEAVLSESFFLLERAKEGKDRLCALLERGVVAVAFEEFTSHSAETLRLLKRYSATPMSFADACLVRMAELYENAPIFTTDADFASIAKMAGSRFHC